MSLYQRFKNDVNKLDINDLKSLQKCVEKRIEYLSSFDEDHFTEYLSTLSVERLNEMLDIVGPMTCKKHTPIGILTQEYEQFEKFLNACSEEQLVLVEMCIDSMLPECDGPSMFDSDDESS